MSRFATLALFLTLFLGLTLPTPALAGMEEEAGRQHDFAKKELAKGEYAKAVQSAESALRLDPTLYRAFVTKALAYEGLGNLDLAESLLVAFQELTKGMQPDDAVAVALERIRTAKSAGRRAASKRPRAIVDRTKDVPETTEPPTAVPDLDPGGYRVRVEDALRLGQCAAARAAGTELTLAAPDLADGYRLLGDAERCAGKARDAVRAYRRYRELGGVDRTVDKLVDGLSMSLGRLTVDVAVEEGAPIPLVRLVLPGEEQLTPAPQADGALLFNDLPAGAELLLLVAGRGLESLAQPVAAFAAGQDRTLSVTPKYIGLGSVKVLQFDREAAATVLLTADEEIVMAPGATRTVTAGAVSAVVSNTYGEVEVPLTVARDATVVFDPTPWFPAELTVVDLPAGSTVRVFVESEDGVTLEKEIAIPSGVGAVDPTSGVRLAPPRRVHSLVGGVGGLFVEHPRLGEGSASVVLASGSVNATTFVWRPMPGVAEIEAEYERWKRNDTLLRRKATGGTAATVGVAIGSGIASGILWASAVAKGREIDEAISQASGASGDDFVHWSNVYKNAQRDEKGLAAAGSVAAGVAAVGLGLSVVLTFRGKRELASLGEWDPQ